MDPPTMGAIPSGRVPFWASPLDLQLGNPVLAADTVAAVHSNTSGPELCRVSDGDQSRGRRARAAIASLAALLDANDGNRGPAGGVSDLVGERTWARGARHPPREHIVVALPGVVDRQWVERLADRARARRVDPARGDGLDVGGAVGIRI